MFSTDPLSTYLMKNDKLNRYINGDEATKEKVIDELDQDLRKGLITCADTLNSYGRLQQLAKAKEQSVLQAKEPKDTTATIKAPQHYSEKLGTQTSLHAATAETKGHVEQKETQQSISQVSAVEPRAKTKTSQAWYSKFKGRAKAQGVSEVDKTIYNMDIFNTRYRVS